eukprot:3338331-Rhodomonas_salina.1
MLPSQSQSSAVPPTAARGTTYGRTASGHVRHGPQSGAVGPTVTCSTSYGHVQYGLRSRGEGGQTWACSSRGEGGCAGRGRGRRSAARARLSGLP